MGARCLTAVTPLSVWLQVLDQLEEVRICKGYKINGEELPSGSAAKNYQVSVSNDGYRYVLRTSAKGGSEILLESDSDGTILGCLCDDPVYCTTEHAEDLAEFEKRYGELLY